MDTLYDSCSSLYDQNVNMSVNMSVYMDENGYYIPVDKLEQNCNENCMENEQSISPVNQVNPIGLTNPVSSASLGSVDSVGSVEQFEQIRKNECVKKKDEKKDEKKPLRLVHKGQLEYCKKLNVKVDENKYIDANKQMFFEKVFQAEKIIENDMNEAEKLNQFRELCRAKNKEACYWLYVNGYFFAGMEFPQLLKERKIALSMRLRALKRNRVNELWKYSSMSLYFHPRWKKLILDLTDCKKPKGILMKISLILNYYLRPGDMYMYNPINRAGYKYYSGENIIIYVVYENMSPVQKSRLKNAWNSKLVNGYDVENAWKVIITLDWNTSWITKHDQLNEGWEIHRVVDVHPYTRKKVNLVESFFVAWLGEHAFRNTFVNHCTLRNIPLWFDC